MKLSPVRYRGYLRFYCIRKQHDHGEPHWIMKSMRRDDVLVDPHELYPLITERGQTKRMAG